MRSIRAITLIIAAMLFGSVLGGAIYEHLAIVPQWSAAPPLSLAMFQGEFGVAAYRFWVPIHPVTTVLLLAALAVNWKTARRNYIIIVLAGYFFALLVTFSYFVPELLAITSTPYIAGVDAALTDRAQMWEKLSLVRLVWIALLSFILLFSLTKSSEPTVPAPKPAADNPS
jgi:hypothetical protein